MTTTDRVLKPWKRVTIPSAVYTADKAMLLSDGTTKIDLSDVNVKRIVVELNVTAFSGTNFVVDVKTTSSPTFAFSDTEASNIQAVKADGSTAFSSATISATGRYSFATGLFAADGSAASNIGKYIGLFFDNNATSVTLDAIVYIEGQ